MKRNCVVREKSIPTPWKIFGNSKGEGGSYNLKISEAKYETKLEFPRERGCKEKPCMGEYGYFLELHI